MDETVIFLLNKSALEKIQTGFRATYNEMEHAAIKKFKHHQLLIARELRLFITEVLENEISEEEQDIDDGYSSSMSLDSENLHYNFRKQLELLNFNIKLPGHNLLYELEGDEYLGFPDNETSKKAKDKLGGKFTNKKKLAVRRGNFDSQF